MDVIQPLAEHEVVLLLLQLGLLLLTARGLGLVAIRFGMPSVVGELLAGVVIGPSILGSLAPGVFDAIVPADEGQFHLLEVISHLGVIMLLVVTGLETDIGLIVSKGRTALTISLCGIVVPFATGFGLGQVLPESFVADPAQRLIFSLFLGTALGISAIPVIAKVLIEMGVVRRDIGQITLAAGMIDDTIGWILLSIVAGLARSGVVDVPSVAQSIISVVVVVGMSFTVGRRFVTWLLREADNRVGGEGIKITLLMVLTFLMGSLTHFLGIEAVLGAFLVGVLVGQIRRFDARARHIVETITMSVFAPIFFAASGLRVDLTALFDPTVALIGLAVLGTAIVGKFVGAALGARWSGLDKWEAISLGAGLNARGAIEIIVATIGLSLGILTQEMFTIILLVAIVTSLMAPPLLRWSLAHVPLGDVERARLQQEDRQGRSFVGALNRVLLPTRGGTNSQVAAQLLALTLHGTSDTEVTTMTAVESDTTQTSRVVGSAPAAGGATGVALAKRRITDAEQIVESVEAFLDPIPRHERRRLIQQAADDVVATIVTEACRGYDLMVLGATEVRSDDTMFGSVTDRLVQDAPCPVFVLAQPEGSPASTLPPQRILLPISGTRAESHAVEVAATIAAAANATLEVVHSIDSTLREEISAGSLADALIIADGVVRSVVDECISHGARVRTHIRVGHRPVETILEVAERIEADLIVLSSALRPMSGRAFFGHGVDALLHQAHCPVLIVS